ncbi:hypothetical protein TNCV_1822211 [Trichonephila clavipes]|nr:hypothetical protein TNCV_1822211 [Trichonephila clavipes]
MHENEEDLNVEDKQEFEQQGASEMELLSLVLFVMKQQNTKCTFGDSDREQTNRELQHYFDSSNVWEREIVEKNIQFDPPNISAKGLQIFIASFCPLPFNSWTGTTSLLTNDSILELYLVGAYIRSAFRNYRFVLTKPQW